MTPAPTDWRTTLRRRTAVAFVCLGPVGRRHRSAAGLPAGVPPRRPRRPGRRSSRAGRSSRGGKRGDILDRKGRVLATSVDADTVYAVPSAIEDPAGVSTAIVRRARRLRRRVAQHRSTSELGQDARVRLGPASGVAGAGAARRGPEARRHRLHEGETGASTRTSELAAHLLGYVGLDNTGLSGIECHVRRSIRGKPGTVLVQTDAQRHAFSRVERPPTTGIDRRADDRRVPPAHRRARAARRASRERARGGTAIVMDPRTGEILAMANEPTFNPNVYRELDEARGATAPSQDLYEPGSTFKIVTASAAIEEKVMPLDDADRHQPGLHPDRSRASPTTCITTTACSRSGRHRQVEQRRRDQDRIQGRCRAAEPLRAALRIRPPRLAGLSRRERRHRLEPGEVTESALASVSMGYQIGVTPLQMAAAVSSVANGGELRRAARRARGVSRRPRGTRPPKVVRRAISAETAADADDDHGRRRRARHGEARADRRLHDRGQDGHGCRSSSTAATRRATTTRSFVGFMPSRKPVVTIVVVIDSPHGPPVYGGTVAAPIFKRIAEAALRHLGVGADDQPAPPVLVPAATPMSARRRRRAPASISRSSAVAADGRTMPDLQRPQRARRVAPAGHARPDARASTATASSSRSIRGRRRRSTRQLNADCAGAAAGRTPAQPTGGDSHDLARAMTLERRARHARSQPSRLPVPRRLDAPSPASRTTRARRRRRRCSLRFAGVHADGAAFVRQAVARGAVAIVVRAARVRPRRRAVGAGRPTRAWRWPCSRPAFYGHPSDELRVVGITGTNGKTTTAYLLASIFEAAGVACGLLGTVAYRDRRRGSRGDAHDARGAGRPAPAARDGRSRLRRLRDGGVVARAGAAPRRCACVSPPACSRT